MAQKVFGSQPMLRAGLLKVEFTKVMNTFLKAFLLDTGFHRRRCVALYLPLGHRGEIANKPVWFVKGIRFTRIWQRHI